MWEMSYSIGISYLILVAKKGDLFINRMSSENVSEWNVFEAFFLSNVIICNTKITSQFRNTNAACRAMPKESIETMLNIPSFLRQTDVT